MAKYRKKPVVVDAFQWNPYSRPPFEFDVMDCEVVGTKLAIKTLEGVMTADVGDWIIKGVAGEFYPCKPDIFEKTYEKVG